MRTVMWNAWIRRAIPAVAIGGILAAAAQARADGGYFVPHADVALGKVASIGAQRALIWFRPRTIELHVETRSGGDATGFYWLLPLQAVPEAVLEAHSAFLDSLDAAT
ncbi:MAG: hypothetical protein FJ087_16655, partial [Deltaproteobacteria bacterium]|nr:hypothetical protein [Deltaproteobacteria bacterium]